MDVSSIALQGLHRAQNQLQNTAVNVASLGSPGSDTVDLSQAAVALISAKTQFAANIGVLKIAGDMQKNLLNVLG